MSAPQIRVLPYEHPNFGTMYGFLVHDPGRGKTFAIDAGDDAAYLTALDETGWGLDAIFITHHHQDHVSHKDALAKATGAEIYGPKGIQGLDYVIDEGPVPKYGMAVLATPGHTLDMLNFYVPDGQAVFTGDTLFTLGCGRLFEGTPAQMFDSLAKLRDLPADTQIYSPHEWALENLAFALSVYPNHQPLLDRAPIVRQTREQGKAMVPSLLRDELATNPFLLAQTVQEFAHIRAAKDAF